MPIIRPLVLMNQRDPNTYGLGHTFLFGNELLVAPFLAPNATQRDVYLPPGGWYDYWTNRRFEGGRVVTWSGTGAQLPLFAREGAIIPLISPEVQTLVDARAPDSIDAPLAAIDYARRLAQQDVPGALLIRAYRVGQARFLRHCIEELLRQSSGDHVEGLATLEMVETVSDYVDCVVEQVLTTYGLARDDWLRDRSF